MLPQIVVHPKGKQSRLTLAWHVEVFAAVLQRRLPHWLIVQVFSIIAGGQVVARCSALRQCMLVASLQPLACCDFPKA
jgi:hypothetical protein